MRMLSKIFYFLQLMPKSNNHNLVHKQVKEKQQRNKGEKHYTQHQPPTHPQFKFPARKPSKLSERN